MKVLFMAHPYVCKKNLHFNWIISKPFFLCKCDLARIQIHCTFIYLAMYIKVCVDGPDWKLELTRPNFARPSSRIALVYQFFCSRTIADQL